MLFGIHQSQFSFIGMHSFLILCITLATAKMSRFSVHNSIEISTTNNKIPHKNISHNSKQSEYFYIYEFPGWDQIAYASIYKRDSNERLENQLHQGAGPLVNESTGAYHTDQYQLYSMFFYRALKDPRRTLDPSKATTFFIPYDFASDSAYYKNCARSHGVCFDFRKCPLAPKVEALLQNSSWYQRNQGRDHVLIVGMNYAMDHYILKPKCKSLLAGTCRNCTKFAIDDYSFMYSTDAGIVARGDYWHAVPFPADFHWSRGVARPFPWENTNRPLVVSYTGSEKSYYGPSRRLRSSITHYCALHVAHCAHKSYGLNGTRFSFKVDGHSPLSLSHYSIFCFQPTGDLMTRKGLFDSLLQGCIPVVFDPLTAHVMYTWHWEEAFWKEVIVELPFHPVAYRYQDPVEYLVQLTKNNASLVAHKQELIRRRVFELQYSLEGFTEFYQFDSSLPYLIAVAGNASDGSGVLYHTKNSSNHESIISSDGINWPLSDDSEGNERSAPMRDAFDIAMDYALAWHSGSLKRERNATVPECWDGKLDVALNKCVVDGSRNSGVSI